VAKTNLFEELFLLQRIDQLIRTRATGTPSKLANILGISERNVYRLIADLRENGFPIAYDRESGNYFYKEMVKLEISIIVGKDKLISIRGGEKKSDYFSLLPYFGSTNV